MKTASAFRLEDLVGRWVRTTRDLSGIKVGDIGKVVKVYGWKGHQGIAERPHRNQSGTFGVS